jgi:seryl-tRNA synthetase
MLTHVKLVTFSLKTMAYNFRIKTLLFFLLFIIHACANDGKKISKRYIEDEQLGNLYEQNGLPTANEETLLDKVITTIMKERAMEKLKETIMQEITQQITNLKATIENQNIVIDQLVQKMTEKDKVIDNLDSRLRLHEESHERMAQGIYSIPQNQMPQQSPQESKKVCIRKFRKVQMKRCHYKFTITATTTSQILTEIMILKIRLP